MVLNIYMMHHTFMPENTTLPKSLYFSMSILFAVVNVNPLFACMSENKMPGELHTESCSVMPHKGLSTDTSTGMKLRSRAIFLVGTKALPQWIAKNYKLCGLKREWASLFVELLVQGNNIYSLTPTEHRYFR